MSLYAARDGISLSRDSTKLENEKIYRPLSPLPSLFLSLSHPFSDPLIISVRIPRDTGVHVARVLSRLRSMNGGERGTNEVERFGDTRGNGLINSNGLLPKRTGREGGGTEQSVARLLLRRASFRNYPRPSASDCRLIAQVRKHPPGMGEIGDTFPLAYKCFSIFAADPDPPAGFRPFRIRFVPNDQTFPGHEQRAPDGTDRSLRNFPRASPSSWLSWADSEFAAVIGRRSVTHVRTESAAFFRLDARAESWRRLDDSARFDASSRIRIARGSLDLVLGALNVSDVCAMTNCTECITTRLRTNTSLRHLFTVMSRRAHALFVMTSFTSTSR